MEKLARRSPWVNKQWGQSKEAILSSLQPLTCAMEGPFSPCCDSNPIWIVQEPAVLSRDWEGLLLNAPSSSLLQAMEPLILITFPFQIPKS